MSMIARRFFFLLAVLFLALLAAYSVLWFVAAGRLEDGVRTWSERQTARGTAVTFGRLDVSGFPGPVTATIDALRIASAGGDWQLFTPRATLAMQPWNWWRYRVVPTGDQQIEYRLDGRRERLTIRPAQALVVVAVDRRGRLESGTLEAADVGVSDASGAALARVAALQGALLMRAPAGVTQPQAVMDISLQARTIDLGADATLGKRIQQISAVAAVKGALPDRLVRPAVDAWREGGGVLEVSQFQMDWGALSLRASGTVTLDEAFRPLGAATADIKGYAETLSALQRARIIRRKAANGTRLALDLLARRDDGDGRRVITVPVTAQNGALYLGPVPLLRLAPISFPARSG